MHCVDLDERYSNAYFVAKFGFDTEENEACKVCQLSAYRSPRSRTMWRRGVGRYSLAAPFTTPLAAPAPPAEPLASLSLRWPLLRILLGTLHRRALCAFVLAFDALRGVLGRRISRLSRITGFHFLNLCSSYSHYQSRVPCAQPRHCAPHHRISCFDSAHFLLALSEQSALCTFFISFP